MKFMITWKIAPGFHKTAAQAFLQNQAAAPDGMTILGRWHAPGSMYGWMLAEADDLAPCAQHAAEWADLLTLDITPVIDDETAGQAFAKVYGA